MKGKLMTAVIFGSLAIPAIPVFAQPERAQTFNGVVSDNMCGKQHMEKDKSAAQCTRGEVGFRLCTRRWRQGVYVEKQQGRYRRVRWRQSDCHRHGKG